MQNSTSHYTNQNADLVSVVIPVYNVERYIEEALDSVLAQTYTNLEVLVVDDESPDASIALVEEYADPRIKIIRQENRGLAGARNTGIRAACGKYVAFLDSDDFWHEEKVEKQLNLMQSISGCGVSFSSSLFVDENSRSLNRFQSPKKHDGYNAGDVFCRNPIGNGSVPIILKSVLEQVRFSSEDKVQNGLPYVQYFDESLRQSEDVDCWTRIALLTDTQFKYIDQPLTNYRLNNEGLSADVDKQFATWLTLLDKLESYAPEFASEYGSVAKAFQYRYLARRSVFQGQAFSGLKLMWRAFKTDAPALMQEPGKTIETSIASVIFSVFPFFLPWMLSILNRQSS